MTAAAFAENLNGSLIFVIFVTFFFVRLYKAGEIPYNRCLPNLPGKRTVSNM